MTLTPRTFAALVGASICLPAVGADWQALAGPWAITGSQTAPWAAPTHPQRSAESRRLAGKRVLFTPQRVVGPHPLGCNRARYKVEIVGPDMIFEGMLAEPRDGRGGGIVGAAATASSLGFDTPQKITTLDAGCTEVRFHVLHRGVMVFALNNRIYTMVRRKP
jgi:hypothetical protein